MDATAHTEPKEGDFPVGRGAVENGAWDEKDTALLL